MASFLPIFFFVFISIFLSLLLIANIGEFITTITRTPPSTTTPTPIPTLSPTLTNVNQSAQIAPPVATNPHRQPGAAPPPPPPLATTLPVRGTESVQRETDPLPIAAPQILPQLNHIFHEFITAIADPHRQPGATPAAAGTPPVRESNQPPIATPEFLPQLIHIFHNFITAIADPHRRQPSAAAAAAAASTPRVRTGNATTLHIEGRIRHDGFEIAVNQGSVEETIAMLVANAVAAAAWNCNGGANNRGRR